MAKTNVIKQTRPSKRFHRCIWKCTRTSIVWMLSMQQHYGVQNFSEIQFEYESKQKHSIIIQKACHSSTKAFYLKFNVSLLRLLSKCSTQRTTICSYKLQTLDKSFRLVLWQTRKIFVFRHASIFSFAKVTYRTRSAIASATCNKRYTAACVCCHGTKARQNKSTVVLRLVPHRQRTTWLCF